MVGKKRRLLGKRFKKKNVKEEGKEDGKQPDK